MSNRPVTIYGNWKMNQDLESIKEFFLVLADFQINNDVVSGLAPQALHIQKVAELANKFGIKVGAQDCSAYESGAFTGECSPLAIKDMGCDFVLVGHSERRNYHNESEALLNEKVKRVLSVGLECVYCIGETLEQREANQTENVLKSQLESGLNGVSELLCNSKTPLNERLVIAYEPVWAIGTGVTASPEQAEQSQQFIRECLKTQFGEVSQRIVILYGGSVKPSNIKELLNCPNVDGALVGGASLKAESFSALCSG